MIRAVGKDDKGNKIIIAGLTEENIVRLKDNKPILADFPDGTRVMILYGESLADITDDLKSLGWM
jgi:hypothetical protein